MYFERESSARRESRPAPGVASVDSMAMLKT